MDHWPLHPDLELPIPGRVHKVPEFLFIPKVFSCTFYAWGTVIFQQVWASYCSVKGIYNFTAYEDILDNSVLSALRQQIEKGTKYWSNVQLFTCLWLYSVFDFFDPIHLNDIFWMASQRIFIALRGQKWDLQQPLLLAGLTLPHAVLHLHWRNSSIQDS